MEFWDRLVARTQRRSRKKRYQNARDIALAASFVRSLETEDAAANAELQQLSAELDRIAENLSKSLRRAA